LVQELFANRTTFNPILLKYPKAAALSGLIRDQVLTRSIEDVLRELSAVPQLTVQRQVWEIPLYLQELLGEVGEYFAPGGAGTRYDTLVHLIDRSAYDSVLYITVNYDRFLERALERFYDVSFNNIYSYCEPGRKWSLVKLHGSVNWGRRLQNGSVENGVLTIKGESLDLAGDIEVLRGHQHSHRVRDVAYYYPSLAIPIGGKEEFACPAAHLQVMDRQLRECSGFIFIGFSCLDSHVINRFAQVPRFSRLEMVNGTHAFGRSAYTKLAAASPVFDGCRPEDVTTNFGFREFVRDGRLQAFLSVV
jgi:hypothetical protein